jgi:hypothetical protein
MICLNLAFLIILILSLSLRIMTMFYLNSVSLWFNGLYCCPWFSHVSKSLSISISWLVPPHIKYRINLWLIIPVMIKKGFSELKKILMWCSFGQQSLLQLRSQSYFLSHTLMGSIHLCYVDFSLVTIGNGVMTNDRWCRDDTESLLWCTHGWAARHALVSRLIVVIHYGTILMCYLLWTLSQNDRCILSRYVAIFYPNLSSVSGQIPSHEFASISSLGVTCFSTLKDPHSNLGTRFFLRGEGCDTLGVSFVLRREIYPNLGRSVKNSISRSCLSLFIRLSLGSSPNSELFDREKQPNLERVKTFNSWHGCKTRYSISIYKSRLTLM